MKQKSSKQVDLQEVNNGVEYENTKLESIKTYDLLNLNFDMILKIITWRKISGTKSFWLVNNY